jgi:hypothetical protein
MIDIERIARGAGPGLATLADIDGWPVQLQRFAALVRNEVLEEAVEALRKEYMTGTKPTFLYDLEGAIRALKDKP